MRLDKLNILWPFNDSGDLSQHWKNDEVLVIWSKVAGARSAVLGPRTGFTGGVFLSDLNLIIEVGGNCSGLRLRLPVYLIGW